MAASPSGRRFTLEDYLSLEEADRWAKHEYFRGTIYAMAGASPEHSALATTMTGLLLARLAGRPCVPHGSDLRLALFDEDFYTYADGSVVCGEMVRHPRSGTHVLNPSVVIEVLSDRTEDYDRGEKRELYQRMPSLREYVLIAQDRRSIEVYARRDLGAEWVFTVHRAGETVYLPSIDVSFPLNELYELARVNVS